MLAVMEPWIALFILFSPLWWTLIFVASCVIIYALERKTYSGPLATTTFIVTVLLLAFFGQPTLLDLSAGHSFYLWLSLILGYIAGGAIYAVVKWYLFCGKKLEEYENVKLKWLRDHGIKSNIVPEELKSTFKKYLIDDGRWTVYVYAKDGSKVKDVEIAVRPWNYASTILLWLSYWPWSLAWSLLDDVVRGIFTRIRRALVNLMDYISKLVFKNVQADFTEAVVETDPESKV